MHAVRTLIAGTVLASAVFIAPASAGTFLGNTIAGAAGYPDGPFGTPGNSYDVGPLQRVVGAGVEFGSDDFNPFFGTSFDFAATTITVAASASNSFGTFNGYSFFDVFATIDPIVNVKILSDSSGLLSGDPGRITFDTNRININVQGLTFSDATIVLDVEFDQGTATPIPAALPLLASGIAALGLFGRRRNRKERATA